MSAEPPQSFPHNALWRKLRRRYFIKGFHTLFAGLTFLPPAICGITWLCHGPLWPWLTICFGILWALTSAFFVLTVVFTLTMRYSGKLRVPLRWDYLFFGGFINGTVLLALLMGQVDWAFYSMFGLTSLSELWDYGCSLPQRTLKLALAAALCLAFAAHAAWLVALLLVLHALQHYGIRPPLVEQIKRKSTRAEFVARSREACAAGGG